MRIFFLLMALAFGGMITSAGAQTVVVAVSGTDEFTPGDIFDPGQTITILKGARLTTLTKAGEMSVIEGPYSGIPAEQKIQSDEFQSQWNAVTALFGDPDARSEVLGVSRDIEGNVPPTPAVWHVSVDSSGPRCTPASTLTLWRRNAEVTQTVSVRSAAASLKDLAWAAGQNTLLIPDSFLLQDGRLLISIDGSVRDLDLHVFSGAINENETGALLGWLVGKKCERQAWSLIRQVHLGKAENQ